MVVVFGTAARVGLANSSAFASEGTFLRPLAAVLCRLIGQPPCSLAPGRRPVGVGKLTQGAQLARDPDCPPHEPRPGWGWHGNSGCGQSRPGAAAMRLPILYTTPALYFEFHAAVDLHEPTFRTCPFPSSHCKLELPRSPATTGKPQTGG